MEKIKLTAIVKTQNSEKTICETLESLTFVDEVIALDSHSTDDTIEFLNEYKAKIIYLTKGELQAAFDEALTSAQNEWIIVLEDDEIISKRTLNEVESYILKEDKKKRNCISLDRKVFYQDKELKAFYDKKLLRIFKKGSIEAICDFDITLKPKGSKVYNLKKDNCILKYDKNSIAKTISDLVEKNTLKLRAEKKKRASILFKPLSTFIYLYFFKGALFDGSKGLIYSINRAIETYIFEMMKKEKLEKGNLE